MPTILVGLHFLVAQLLSKEKQIGVFGNKRNTFIFNTDEQSLNSFGDFVALVLQKKFQGAANLMELSAFLQDSKVIAKKVTPTILEGDEIVGWLQEAAINEAENRPNGLEPDLSLKGWSWRR